MSELAKLEAGKTYVFKDELACILWSDIDENDYIRSEFYDDGFAIDEVYEGDGYIWDNCIIIADELKYFKLKEEETMQQPKHLRPEDEVMITTTYGELAKVYLLVAKSNGHAGFGTFEKCKQLFGDKDGDKLDQIYHKFSIDNYCGIESEWLKILFPQPTPVESPTQRKARELREKAEELLAKAKELEEEV